MSGTQRYTLLGQPIPEGFTRPNEGTLLDQMYTLRNAAAGVAQVPRGVLSLVGADETANAIGEFVNRNLGTSDAQWNVEPGAFVAQNAGAALVGIPARALAAAGTAFPALAQFAARHPVATRVVEALTPVTLPLSPGNVLLNTAGGSVVGAGLQSLDAALASTPPQIPLDDGIVGDVPPQQAAQTPMQRQEASQAAAGIPLDAGIVGDSTPVQEIPLDDVIEPTIGDRIRAVLPYALLGGGATFAGAQAARQAYRRAQNTAALQGSIVQPGAPADPTIVRTADTGPLSGAIGAGREFERQVFDEGAIATGIIRDAERAGAISTPRAEALRAAVDVNANLIAREEQAAAVLNTGIVQSGHRIGRPMTVLADEFATLDAPTNARVQEWLTARNELANRQRAAEEWFRTRDTQYLSSERDPATGRHLYADVPITDAQGNTRIVRMEEPARVGLWDRSFEDLGRIVAAGQNDPAVQRYAQEFQQRAENWRRVLVREGYIRQDEAQRMARANPYYLPTLDVEAGNAQRHFRYRPVTDRSQPYRGQDVIQSWQDYEQHAVRVLQHNRAKRAVARALEEVQRTLPNDRRIVGRVLPDDATTNAPDVVTFRENGRRYKIEVFAPGIAPVLRNEPKFVIPVLNGTRKWFQFFTTGPGAALAGAPFAPVSAMYNTFSTLATRPVHLNTGYFDALVKRATGGRMGVRMDPTFVLQSLAAPFADLGSIAARELSRRFQGTSMQPMASYLSRVYERSVHAEMQRYGATNSGIAATADFGNNLPTSVGQISPSYNAVRGTASGVPQSVAEFQQYAARFGATAVPRQAVDAWHLFREIIDIVSNAPQSALWRQNRDRVQDQARGAGLGAREGLEGLARRVRRAGADPSIAGANRGVTGLLSAVPYGNVAMQSLSVYSKALRENPLGTTTAIALGTVVPALAALWTAMEADEASIALGEEPTRVRSLMLGSTNGRAQGVDIYLPGLPDEAAFRFIPDPTMTPVLNAVMSTLGQMMGAHDVRYFFSEDNARNRDIVRRLINDHEGRVMYESIQRAGGQLAPPPLLDVAGRLMGVDIREALGVVQPRIGDLRRRTAPGYEEGAIPDDPIAPQVRHVLEGLFGAAGVAGVNHVRHLSILARADAPTDTQFAAALGMARQRNEDRLPTTRMLYPERLQRDMFDAGAGFVREAENAMERVAAGMGDITRPGTIGSERVAAVPQYGPGRVRPPDDIVPVLQQIAGLHRGMQQMRDLRTRAMQEISSAQSVPRGGEPTPGQYALLTDPQRMREFANRQRDGVRELNGQMAMRIVDLERELSARYNRRIRIADIDPTRGLDQFPTLQGTSPARGGLLLD